MKIYVSNKAGNIISLDLKPSNNIEDLKTNIQSELGIPFDQQMLIFAGMQLEGSKTLEDYNIKNEFTIKMIRRPKDSMQIFIQIFNGKTITLDTKLSEIFMIIKLKIQDMEGIQFYDQILMFSGKILDNCRTLGSYNIQNASHIRLVNNYDFSILLKTLTDAIYL